MVLLSPFKQQNIKNGYSIWHVYSCENEYCKQLFWLFLLLIKLNSAVYKIPSKDIEL